MSNYLAWNEAAQAYVAEFSYNDRHIPKEAGFTWDKIVPKKWATKDATKAAKLIKWATGPTRQRLEGLAKQRTEALSMSRAASMDGLELTQPEGLEYLPYQKVGVKFSLDRAGTLIADDMGLGKAQPLDAKVLTPTGWVTMGEIRAGMQVVGSNGKPTTVTGVYPQGVKDIYRITFTDGSSTEACGDHLWLVNSPLRKWRGAPARVKTTQEIRQSLRHINGNLQHFVPMVNPVQFAVAQPLPVDPYLMGVLLGDGGIGNHQVIVTTADEEMLVDIAAALPVGNTLVHVSRYDYRINGPHSGIKNPLTQELKKLGLMGTKSGTKFIPDCYLYASPEDRVALLQGLLDTDGSVQPGTPTVEFSVASEALAKGVQFIVQSLGGTFQYRQGKTDGQDRYRGTVRLPDYIPPFRLLRKLEAYQPRTKYPVSRGIQSVELVGQKQAQCIAVDAADHLYVTDDFIVTHNTIQAIGVINNDPSIKRILVVCPASLKLNWKRELEKWLTRPLTVAIVDPKEVPDADVLICNYDILHRFDFAEMEWDLVVADEVHYTKNKDARRSKALHAITGKRRLGLTGTPICNKPSELWPIIHWVDPDKWDKFWPFAQRYCGASRGSYGWDFTGATNLEELQVELRSSCMVRRLKKDVLKELPPKRRAVVVIPRNGSTKVVDEEMAAYERHKAAVEEAMAERDLAKAGGDKEAYAQAVTRLRQIEGIMLAEMSRHRALTALSKAPHVAEHVENILADNDGYKVIVFAHHKAVVDLLIDRLKQYNPVKVTGDVSMTNRQAAVDRFQTDPDCQVFVGNIQAAGVGLTLTAAAHVVFAELDWVPGNVTQAEDRAHRLGQQDSVLIEHLVFDQSLDAKMAKTIIAKQHIIEQALDNEVNPEDIVLAEEEPSRVQKATKAVLDLTTAQVHAVQEALRILAGMDADHAAARNEMGFNRYDSKVGHSLAQQERLSDKQAALGARVVRKYKRQLPTRIVEILGGIVL